MPPQPNSYDYIIVGAGSAGCVLASRLSEDPHARVLLLEAGGPARRREIRIPAAYSKLFKSALDWNFSTEPEPHLHNRRLYWPRGKVLGGSTAINAMIYIRGNRLDYDHWAALGNDGWSFTDVLPYFKKSENQERGASEFHGVGGGPLCISDLRCVNPLTRVFLAAANELGFAANPDFNGAMQLGAGLYQVTQKNGSRHSAADGFLHPALSRPNLRVLTAAHAMRILIENHRVTGVKFLRNRAVEAVRAEREVILSGGAVNSPQLLLLSGIGPADELTRSGVRVIHDLPGVGKHLQDHPMVSAGYLCTKPITLQSADSLRNVLQYFVLKRGPLTSNVAEAGIFLNTRGNSPTPDLQILFGPVYYVNQGFDKIREHAFGFAPTLIAPESRGEITLHSADPLAAPAIRANYLACESDLRVMIEGVRTVLRIAESKPFDAFRGARLHPAPQASTDSDLEEFLRNNVQTLYHPAGTCKMGSDDMAVVDSRLRVRGIERLRVADASIMPRVIAGNTNAPTMMIAEKAADMIRADS
jgi:choline dehydrogenase-like flavoprotein